MAQIKARLIAAAASCALACDDAPGSSPATAPSDAAVVEDARIAAGCGGAAGLGGVGGGGAGGAGGAAGADANPRGGAGGMLEPDAGMGAEPCQGGLIACDPLAEFPGSILDMGLFPAAPDLSQTGTPRLHTYVPDPPLWSDGLHKLRHVILPEGQRIDNSDRERWVFPIGTVFIKTFLDDGPAGAPMPVETRFIRRGRAGFYEYAVYRWNEAGTDAELANNSGSRRIPVDVTIAGDTFSHDIPSQIDCEKCHVANAEIASDVIGFDELRLGSTLDASSQETQLAAFAALDYFMSPVPAELEQIIDDAPLQLAVKRFVYGNCVHCHHGEGLVDLRPDALVENTVGVAVDASGVTPPEGFLRVVPQDPEKSVMFLQTRGTDLADTLRPMPPVGVQRPSQEAVDAMRAWIESLPAP